MSNKPKSLMTQYLEGSLVSRDLRDMMVAYAQEARFDDEFKDYEPVQTFNRRDHRARKN